MSYEEAILDSIGDPTRRRILDRLRQGPAGVGEIASDLPVSRPAVSKHLALMERAGLVAHDEVGTRHVYRLDPSGVDALRRWVGTYWDAVLGAFAEEVRRTDRPDERKERRR
jgi:DNA-binding transcriptional ArsR family regulator